MWTFSGGFVGCRRTMRQETCKVNLFVPPLGLRAPFDSQRLDSFHSSSRCQILSKMLEQRTSSTCHKSFKNERTETTDDEESKNKLQRDDFYCFWKLDPSNGRLFHNRNSTGGILERHRRRLDFLLLSLFLRLSISFNSPNRFHLQLNHKREMRFPYSDSREGRKALSKWKSSINKVNRCEVLRRERSF